MRQDVSESKIERKTKETDISVALNIYGDGNVDVDTGIGFFDHMLTALAVHAGWDMSLHAKGDLDVDGHHTVEDVGIALGQALKEALGDKSGVARYGYFTLPMDESLATASLDLAGRAYLVFDADFRTESIGELDSTLIVEFFRAFAFNAEMTLHARVVYGVNDHHKAEALFKALAHALRNATTKTGGGVLSSKGVL
ncbi:MAG: imidazoleglycerol-phosphate dehydratase HisB [Clostridiales Family XIII bacterium]|jgi:imidazoleglycerol-phosphate dehydratase|nr:imidazoleglycerol-phosphate dehydratase HisB [Clostridiales Family XIII bacterium]